MLLYRLCRIVGSFLIEILFYIIYTNYLSRSYKTFMFRTNKHYLQMLYFVHVVIINYYSYYVSLRGLQSKKNTKCHSCSSLEKVAAVNLLFCKTLHTRVSLQYSAYPKYDKTGKLCRQTKQLTQSNNPIQL